VFGLSSTLIPAGYNNDEYFYQCPHQSLWSNSIENQNLPTDRPDNTIGPAMLNSPHQNIESSSHDHHHFEEIQIPENNVTKYNNALEETTTNHQTRYLSSKMKSGRFLIIHTILSTLILSGCAIYISITKDNLSDSSSNALILPQILAVVPGCFFTLSRSVLYLKENKPKIFPKKAWKVLLIMFSAILAIIAYGSVIPALFWSLLWKVTGSALDLIEEIEKSI